MTDHETSDAFKTFKQAAEKFNQQPPLEYRDCNNERDYPVPSGHAPRLAEDGDDELGLLIVEQERGISDGQAWMYAENPWSVDE